jgi:DNA-binding MurR/RpiR family transcriptional regulator
LQQLIRNNICVNIVIVQSPNLSPQAVQRMIESRFDSLSPELQRAARWVAQHSPALALQSMRHSARAAGVTPATMTRLAQRLGFEGFDDLRAPFRRHIASAARAAPASAASNPLNALQQANVASVAGLNQPVDFDAAARLLIEAPQVHFLGLRVCHGVAFFMAYAYALVCDNGRLVSGAGGTFDDQVARIDKGGVLVAISQSPHARQTVDAVATARRHGVAVVALTDSRLSPLVHDARIVLLYDTASNAYLHSTAGAQALAETLVAAVAERGGAATQQHLRRMQSRLQDSGAYWEQPQEQE